MKFNPFASKRPMSDSIFLPITPMASIFTVILVILLKSFTNGVTNISPTEAIQLPEISSAAEAQEGLKIEVFQGGIRVGDRKAVTLQEFKFTSDAGIDELSAALATEKQLRVNPAQSTQAVLMADEGAPYELIRKVVSASVKAGFSQLRLLVVNKE